ncbi:MAG TPA: fluoride efflux transporter CrcB [Tepidisphaeraceae bacterium]|nr:fluoride efflux transporter CrcB [Tepidisphaeraceae bacterium]
MKTTFVQYVAVGTAGFLGAISRLWVGQFCGKHFPTTFPVGTLVINITGSFFLGWFLTIATRHTLPPTLRMAISIGFVGAYTTFSTFMDESHSLLRDGSGIKAMLNLFGSLLLGLMAVRLGIRLAGQ